MTGTRHSFTTTAARAVALALALLLMLGCAGGSVFAASGADVSGGDVSAADVSAADVSASGTSVTDVSATDMPVEPEEPVSLVLGAVAAKAAILYDVETAQLLYEQNADAPLPPASTTKIMTALLVLEAVEAGALTLDEQLEAGSEELAAIPWDASSVKPKIVAGESMSVLDYLNCVMLTSDCACCNVLAKRVSGSVDAFIERMNVRAAELGCEGVTFLNAHGYPKDGHLATARSLLVITLEAMKYPVFTEIASAHDYTIAATGKTAEERKLLNTNGLLVGSSGYAYQYATGVKTGYSKASGYCLVSSAQRDGRTLVAVVLGAEKSTAEDGSTVYESFTESRRLLEWGYNAYAWRAIATAGYVAEQIPLAGADDDHLSLVYKQSAMALLPVELDLATLDYTVTLYSSSATAPVVKGDDYGVVDISRDGVPLASVPIAAGTDAPVKETLSPWLLVAIFGGVVLAIACLVTAVKQARHRQGGYGYDAVAMAEAEDDPANYPYGGRPLYSRSRRGGQPVRPTYTDGGYYTRRDTREADEYDRYVQAVREERERRSDYYDYDEPEPRPIAPIFPREGKWQPPKKG